MTNQKAIPLTLQQMRDLGGNVGDFDFEFDFSQIPYRQYNEFFEALPNILYKKSKKVVFTTKLLKEYEKNHQKNQKLVESSIAQKKPFFIAYLTKILCRTLPKTKLLNTIGFSHIHIPPKMFQQLSSFLGEFPLIKILILKEVDLREKDFKRLFESISPRQFESIEIVACGIPKSAYPLVVKFLDEHKKLGEKSKLRSINLANNQFDAKQLNYIKNESSREFSKPEKSSKPKSETKTREAQFSESESSTKHRKPEKSSKPKAETRKPQLSESESSQELRKPEKSRKPKAETKTREVQLSESESSQELRKPEKSTKHKSKPKTREVRLSESESSSSESSYEESGVQISPNKESSKFPPIADVIASHQPPVELNSRSESQTSSEFGEIPEQKSIHSHQGKSKPSSEVPPSTDIKISSSLEESEEENEEPLHVNQGESKPTSEIPPSSEIKITSSVEESEEDKKEPPINLGAPPSNNQKKTDSEEVSEEEETKQVPINLGVLPQIEQKDSGSEEESEEIKTQLPPPNEQKDSESEEESDIEKKEPPVIPKEEPAINLGLSPSQIEQKNSGSEEESDEIKTQLPPSNEQKDSEEEGEEEFEEIKTQLPPPNEQKDSDSEEESDNEKKEPAAIPKEETPINLGAPPPYTPPNDDQTNSEDEEESEEDKKEPLPNVTGDSIPASPEGAQTALDDSEITSSSGDKEEKNETSPNIPPITTPDNSIPKSSENSPSPRLTLGFKKAKNSDSESEGSSPPPENVLDF